MVGGVIMVVVAYFWGPPALVTATAVAALGTMLWLLRRGVAGYVQNATASVFILIYVPFLGRVRRPDAPRGRSDRLHPYGRRGEGRLHLHRGHRGLRHRRLHRRACSSASTRWRRSSRPKKSWEGFAGSTVFCVAVGVAMVVWVLDADWWIGVCLGLIAVVMATLGDLCESVIKRDLGIKDMSQVIPGHGGLMDRLDSLLATIAPIWLLLHYLVF